MLLSRVAKPALLCKKSSLFAGVGLQGTRCMSGFSSMSPEELNTIVKLNVFTQETPERVDTIWQEYHKKSLAATGFTLHAPDHVAITERMKQCPMFIWPVFKKDNEHVIMLSQKQGKFVFCTYLEDYKRNPETAGPWLSLAMYDDMCASKGMALIRGDFTPNLTKIEGEILSRMILFGYHDEAAYKHVHAFNKTPATFNFEEYLSAFKKVHQNLLEDIEAAKVKALAGESAPAVAS